MIKTLDDFQLSDILPDSLKSDPDVLALSEGLTIVYKQIYEQTKTIKFHEGIPDHLLDFIAYEENVDFYDTSLSVPEKRNLIEKAQFIHKIKGTVAAVEAVVSIFFKNAEVIEWFDYGGNPFNFVIEIDSTVIKDGDLNRLVDLVEATKNLRSRLDKIIAKVFKGTFDFQYKSRHYPVPYPITNMFKTAEVDGKVLSIPIQLQTKVRIFDAPYPITNVLRASLVYEKKVGSLLNGTLLITHYTVPYKNTGENFAGEVEL